MNRNLSTDAEARRQLLLTRIAFERNELRREVAHLREATTLPHLMRSVFGLRAVSSWFGAAAGADGHGRDWIGTGLAWLRRYRLASTVLGALFGGAAPLLRRRGRGRGHARGRWRQITLLGVAGGVAYWLWNNTRRGS